MKKWISKKGNLLFIAAILFLLWNQFPIFLNSLNSEGTILPSKAYHTMSGEITTFPPQNSRAVAIFWATWCAPCKVEMKRLKSSVNSGKIQKESIFAINVFESNTVIRNFLKQEEYPFTFIDAPDVGKKLNAKVTPTTVFIENNKVYSMNTGMSILGIFKAENFLSP